MATKTAIKSTRKGLETKIDLTLTAELVERAIAFKCTWDEKGYFVAPVWCRTRTSATRGVQAAILEEGTQFFKTPRWRDELKQDEARACLAIGRDLRSKFFPELDGE